MGRPPGIFLLMKWITCSLTGAFPSVDGGFAVCLRATRLSKSLARRCTLKPTPTIALRMNLMVCGFVAFKNTIAAALPGRKVF